VDGVGEHCRRFLGRDDHDEMQRAVGRLAGRIDPRMTTTAGRTGRTSRSWTRFTSGRCTCATRAAWPPSPTWRRLDADLGRLVCAGDLCVFAGAMPAGELLEQTVGLVRTCRRAGPALRPIRTDLLSGASWVPA